MADTAKSKASKAKKPASKPTHPPTSQLVTDAIKALNERGGSSLQAIKKYISTNNQIDAEKLAPFIKKYLKNAVVKGDLIQTKGKGASGSFKLPATAPKQKVEKKKPEKVEPKSSASKKKPAAKKAASSTAKVAKKASTAKEKTVKPKATPSKKPSKPSKAAASKKPKAKTKAKKIWIWAPKNSTAAQLRQLAAKYSD